MAVKITLTDVGSSISATLELYCNQTGVWTYIEDVPTATLIGGYTFTPPVGATGYQVRDIGGCGTILEFYCTTSTTTSSSTTSTSTTAAPTGNCWNVQIPTELLTSEGEDLYITRLSLGTYESYAYWMLDDTGLYQPTGIDINICSDAPLGFKYGEFGGAVYLMGIGLISYGGCNYDNDCTGVPGLTTTTTSTVAPTTTTTTTEEGTTTTTTTSGE